MSLKSDIELKSYGTLDDNPKIEKPQGIYQNTLALIVFWYVFTGCWGVRHTFVILAFLGCANMYAMRVNLSVAIVAMVDNTLSGKSTLIHNSYFSIFYIRKDLETNIFQAIQKMKLNLDISVRFLSSSKIQKTNQ